MRAVSISIMHLVVAIAKLLRSGGAKLLVAENLLLKQQLLVLSRARRRAPPLPGEFLLYAAIGKS